LPNKHDWMLSISKVNSQMHIQCHHFTDLTYEQSNWGSIKTVQALA
jgi:hypothetical protein